VSPTITPPQTPAASRQPERGDTQRPIIPASEVLERLSIGEPITGVHVAGTLDMDPLVVSRWLCGEDLRGIYQPILFHDCSIESLDIHGRTFYELVEIVGCVVQQANISQAYFYSSLMIEDARFEGAVNATNIQADGRVVIHGTVFTGHVDLSGILLRQSGNLSVVRFAGGTNLLHETVEQWEAHFPAGLSLSGCAFRPEDVPPGFNLEAHQATLLAEE